MTVITLTVGHVECQLVSALMSTELFTCSTELVEEFYGETPKSKETQPS